MPSGEQESCQEENESHGGQLRSMKLEEATKMVEVGIEETLTYFEFSNGHWTRICANNVIEQKKWEIRH